MKAQQKQQDGVEKKKKEQEDQDIRQGLPIHEKPKDHDDFELSVELAKLRERVGQIDSKVLQQEVCLIRYRPFPDCIVSSHRSF